MLQFSRWFELTQDGVAAYAPTGPAALQVRRASGLHDYPSGKSAMIWYGYAATNAREVLEKVFTEELQTPGLTEHGAQEFRFIEGEEEARESLEKVASKFHRRFGSPPVLNAHSGSRR